MGSHSLLSKIDYLTFRAMITMVIMMMMMMIIIRRRIIITIIIAIIIIIICNEGTKLAKTVLSGDLYFHTI